MAGIYGEKEMVLRGRCLADLRSISAMVAGSSSEQNYYVDSQSIGDVEQNSQ